MINEHVDVGDALAAGRIGSDQADVLAKANSNPNARERLGEFLPRLLDHAEHKELPDFSVIVDRFVANANPDGTEPNDEANATVSAGVFGLHMKVTGGDPLKAAEIKKVFDLAVQAEFDEDCAARRVEFGDDALNQPLPRTARQRRWAAVYAIHMASVSVAPGATPPKPLVNILFSAGAAGRALAQHGLAADSDVFGADREHEAGAAGHHGVEDPDDLLAQRCETSTGAVIDPHTALLAMLRGRVRRVVLDSRDMTINMGAAQRLFVGKSRDAAQLIVMHCSHNGCNIPAEFCDVDHLQPHSHGGVTEQENAGPECGPHNRHAYDAGWTSRRAANGRIYHIRPDGSIVMPAGERPPEWADSDPHRMSDLNCDFDPDPDPDPDRSAARDPEPYRTAASDLSPSSVRSPDPPPERRSKPDPDAAAEIEGQLSIDDAIAEDGDGEVGESIARFDDSPDRRDNGGDWLQVIDGVRFHHRTIGFAEDHRGKCDDERPGDWYVYHADLSDVADAG